MNTNLKKYLAEIVGTFALTLAVFVSVFAGGPIATPIVAALTLGLFVYSLGHVSGAHFNPAVSIGLWSVRKINTKDTLLYIVSQLIGAGLAMFVAQSSGASLALITVNSWAVCLAELIGAAFFTFGIASVVYRKTPSDISGIAIGGSLMLGVVVASSMGSNGILNPAVAYGLGSFNLVYVIGPIIGALIGMNLYKYLSE